MIRKFLHVTNQLRGRPAFLALEALLAIFIAVPQLFADEPYARSRDYDLQHSKIALRFDLDQKKVLGEVTHSLSILRGGSTKIAFDSVGLAIHYEGKPAKGIYFILPDKDYPDRPKQIWTQGESEDTRYYLPTYDYPNDRLTTETIL